MVKRKRMATRGRKRKRSRVMRGTRRKARGTRMTTASFKRMFWKENWAFTTVSTAGFARIYAPTFGDLPNVADYSNLYDQYKICGVKITFRPRWDGADAGPAATVGQNVPYINTYIDPISNYNVTGTYTSANFNGFTESCNGRLRSRQLTKPYSVYWKPLVATTSIVGGGANPSEYIACPWLSTANSAAIPMRQCYVWISDNNFAGTITNWAVDVFYTYYFKAKGQK